MNTSFKDYIKESSVPTPASLFNDYNKNKETARNRMLGKKLSDVTRAKMTGRVGWMHGRKHSEETKEKLKLARRKREITPETRDKMNASHLRNKLKRMEAICV